jgi:hypothetical protein
MSEPASACRENTRYKFRHRSERRQRASSRPRPLARIAFFDSDILPARLLSLRRRVNAAHDEQDERHAAITMLQRNVGLGWPICRLATSGIGPLRRSPRREGHV